MNRRQALRNLGLGAGVLVVGPSTLSLLHSCKKDSAVAWQPTFLSANNGFALKEILEVILPTTDTPGANDLNIAQFIDSYMDQVASDERRKIFEESANAFAVSFENEFDKEPQDGSPEEYEQILKKYLRATPEDREGYVKRNSETQDPMDEDPEEVMNYHVGSYSYLQDIRQMAIWAWKNSEQVGENVLWYDPVPGQYIACGPISELSNGKAMAL
jgi:GrpB-like predicted nucleotidyltransferase (UPF0157 family)